MTKIKEYKTASGETTYWFSHYTGKNRKPGIPKEIVKRGFKSKEEAEFELAKLKLKLKKIHMKRLIIESLRLKKFTDNGT